MYCFTLKKSILDKKVSLQIKNQNAIAAINLLSTNYFQVKNYEATTVWYLDS